MSTLLLRVAISDHDSSACDVVCDVGLVSKLVDTQFVECLVSIRWLSLRNTDTGVLSHDKELMQICEIRGASKSRLSRGTMLLIEIRTTH